MATCLRSFTLTVSDDMPLDQSVYVPSTGKIVGVRGGYLFSFNSTTGVRESSTRFRLSSFSESSIAYDATTDRLYVSCWHDPQGIQESAGNTVAPLKIIYQINPANFAITSTFDPGTAFGMVSNDSAYAGPKQIVASTGIIFGFYYSSSLAGNFTLGAIFKWNPVAGTSLLQPGTNAIYCRGDWMDLLVSNATDIYATQASAFSRRVTFFDITTMDSQPAFFGSSLTWPAGVNPCGIAQSPTSGRLYMTSRTPDILRADTPFAAGVNAASLASITLPNVNANPVRIRYNANDGMIYVPGYGSNEVYVINPTSDTVTATKTGFDSPLDCVFTPSKKFAVQHSASGLREIT